MSKRPIVNLVKYGCCFSFVILWAVSYILMRDFSGGQLMDKCLYLADALTVPGLLLILLGAMVWVANEGALDGIAYCIRFAVFSLIPGKRLERDEKYGDYVERRRGKRVKGYGFLFWAGLITMAIGGIFMAMFYYLYYA